MPRCPYGRTGPQVAWRWALALALIGLGVSTALGEEEVPVLLAPATDAAGPSAEPSPTNRAALERARARLDAMRGQWTAEWESSTESAPIDTPRTARAAALQMAVSDDPAVRQRAIEALALRKEPAGLQEYLWAFADPDPGIRQAAVAALGKIPANVLLEQILDVLVDNQEDAVRALDVALPELDPALGDALLKLFQDDTLTVPIRRAAAYSLGRLRARQALVPLAEGIHTADPSLALSCALALAQLRDTRAVPTWIDLLAHDDPGLRQLAVYALAELGGKAAYDALVAVAGTPEINDPKLVPPAIAGLAAWPLVDCVPALIGVMRSNPGYRQTAAAHLSQRTGLALGDRAEDWENWYLNGLPAEDDADAAPPTEEAPSDLLRHAQFVPPALQGQTF